MNQHRAEFIVESREHLVQFERSLLALEKTRDGEQSKSLIEQALRAIHSLKGDSGFLGFTKLRGLAHAMESLLEDYRDGTILPSAEVIEALLAAGDRLAAMVEDPDHSELSDITDVVDRLLTLEGSRRHSIPFDIKVSEWQRSHGNRSLVELFRELSTLGAVGNPRLSGVPEQLEEWTAGTRADELRFSGILVAHGSSEHASQFLMPFQSEKHNPTVVNSERHDKKQVSVQLTLWHRETGKSLTELFRDIDRSCSVQDPQLILPDHHLAGGLPSGLIEWRGTINAGEELPLGESQPGLTTRISEPAPVQTATGDETQKTVSEPDQNSAKPQTAPTSQSGRSSDPISELAPEKTILSEQRIVAEKRINADKVPTDTVSPRETVVLPEMTSGRVSVKNDTERTRSLRINVELLDRLMNLTGELTLIRNQTQVAFAEEQGESRTLIQRLNNVTSELQETVLQTRMQPVGNLFGRFPRMVRDLARQLGREVEMVTVGQEVELDKTVLERLSDPLTHLIRNSIDHGLESPEVRVAAGKPRAGKILLSATPADGQVCIEIRDDGRGIDPVAIKSRAAATGLRTEAELERMSTRELFSLILLPGFSTARTVTDVSGRGVGMDVVKTNVEELEGHLTIDSWPGRGTSMVLRVPLTLAIVPCLIVTVDQDRFAVPQRELEEIVCLHPNGKRTLENAFDTEVFRLRDVLLPVIRLKDVLTHRRPFTASEKAEILGRHTMKSEDTNRISYILVLRSSGKRLGLLVDQVEGREEIVVKPMHPALRQLAIFSGATLMGDGRVSLIASVEGIAEHARCMALDGDELQKTTTRDPHEVHRVLLFEYGADEQFALPLIQVRRVEMLDMSRVEHVGQQEFVTIDGRSTRILRLSDVLDVSTPEDSSTMFLILPKFVPEPMGILANRIIDTESLAIELQPPGGDRGILGTAIIRGRLSLFLDVQRLREFTFGISHTTAEKPEPPELAKGIRSLVPRSILLVDDTPFFREIVRRYLTDDQTAIVTAVDGQHGMEMLSTQHFDLVVSDIEMPNMDGWQFCRLAREKGYRMPFLALTSLAKADYEQQAKACGFDDFEEKLDHDRLKRKVLQWLEYSKEREIAQ